ncbi:MAG TPA: enoyl-CoA hydratase-related protein [Xanthobacteraceae bacterium]|nr:enoyl-CoA hydratase-related protein [Xanthobacteraceae bacterium]
MSNGVDVDISSRGVATILLNRPERSNAIDQAMLDELARQFAKLAADDRTRVVVFRGAGKHFCSGADLVARASAAADPPAQTGGERAAQTSIADMLAALDRLPKPTIALVHGAAIGGGAAVAACCDIVIAAEGAFFSIPEVRVGMPPLGVTPFVIRAIGFRSFRRYGLTGERFGAAEALRVGLAHEVVSADKLEEKLGEIIDALLHGAPGAQRTLKEGMEHSVTPTVAEIISRKASHGSLRTAEAIEGTLSFKEKRKPSWYPQ